MEELGLHGHLLDCYLLQLLYICLLDQVPACRYLHSGFSFRFFSNRLPDIRTPITGIEAQDNTAPVLFIGLGDAFDHHFLPILAPSVRLCPSDTCAEAVCVSKFRRNLRGAPGAF